MPQTYVVHLGNSKDLMEVAESAKQCGQTGFTGTCARFAWSESETGNLLFGIINSVSRGKGQDLFLRSFHQCLQLIQRKKLQLPSIHAVIVGSDMAAQPKFESQLRNFTQLNQIQSRVHFLNKTLAVAPYLAAIDVLVQNSQRNTLHQHRHFSHLCREEANALEESLLKQWRSIYQSWQLLSAAGGATEIVVNGSTWLLHPVGKSGVTLLAKNMIKLATHVEQRLTMGRRGYERVKEMFLEVHIAQRISTVFMDILQSKSH